MPLFSASSKEKLSSCHPDLQRLFYEVVKYYDCAVLVGYRDKEDQDRAVAAGMSKTPWPTSKHNFMPARAIDVAPFPIDWKNEYRFYHFGGFVLHTAMALSISIRWGGDWNGKLEMQRQGVLVDLPHFELKGVQ